MKTVLASILFATVANANVHADPQARDIVNFGNLDKVARACEKNIETSQQKHMEEAFRQVFPAHAR